MGTKRYGYGMWARKPKNAYAKARELTENNFYKELKALIAKKTYS